MTRHRWLLAALCVWAGCAPASRLLPGAPPVEPTATLWLVLGTPARVAADVPTTRIGLGDGEPDEVYAGYFLPSLAAHLHAEGRFAEVRWGALPDTSLAVYVLHIDALEADLQRRANPNPNVSGGGYDQFLAQRMRYRLVTAHGQVPLLAGEARAETEVGLFNPVRPATFERGIRDLAKAVVNRTPFAR